MKLASSVAILAPFLAASVALQLGSQTHAFAPCGPSEVPLRVNPDSNLKVLSHQISYGIRSQGELRLQNLSSKSILAASLLITYRDSAGTILFSIPYFGGIQDAPERMEVVHPFLLIRWDHPVQSGNDFVLFGSNLLSAREKPVTADAGLVDIYYDDGTQGVASTSLGDFSDPLLVSLPEAFEADLNTRIFPVELIAATQVDTAGHVSTIGLSEDSKLTPQVLEQIKNQIKKWSFFPGTRRGFAAKADLYLWLRFHEKGLPLPEPTCPLDLPPTFPRTFVEVDLRPSAPNHWGVTFSGYPAFGRFEPLVIDMNVGPGKLPARP